MEDSPETRQDSTQAEKFLPKKYTRVLAGVICLAILLISVYYTNPSFQRRASHYMSYQFNKIRYFSFQDTFKKPPSQKANSQNNYVAPTAYPSAGPTKDKYVTIINSKSPTQQDSIFEAKFFPNHEYGQAFNSSTGQYYQYLIKENYDNSLEDILQWNNILLFTKHELDYEKKQITVNVFAYNLTNHENKRVFTTSINVESINDAPDRVDYFSTIGDTLYFIINHEMNYGGIKATLYAVKLSPIASAQKIADGHNIQLKKDGPNYFLKYQGGTDGSCLTGWFDLQAFYPTSQTKGPLLNFSSNNHNLPEFIDYYSDNEIIAATHIEPKVSFDVDDCKGDYTNLYIQNVDDLKKQYLVQGSAMPEQVDGIHLDKKLGKVLLISHYYGTVAVYDISTQVLKKFDLSIQGLMRAEFIDSNNVCIVSSQGTGAADNQYIKLNIDSGEKTPWSTKCEKDKQNNTDDYLNNTKSLQEELNELRLPAEYKIEYYYR